MFHFRVLTLLSEAESNKGLTELVRSMSLPGGVGRPYACGEVQCTEPGRSWKGSLTKLS